MVHQSEHPDDGTPDRCIKKVVSHHAPITLRSNQSHKITRSCTSPPTTFAGDGAIPLANTPSLNKAGDSCMPLFLIDSVACIIMHHHHHNFFRHRIASINHFVSSVSSNHIKQKIPTLSSSHHAPSCCCLHSEDAR